MGVNIRPSPYDQWEWFKLPWYYKLIIFLFLSSRDRQDIYNKIEKINRIRKEDCKRSVDNFRENIMRPRGQTGAVRPSTQQDKFTYYYVYCRIEEEVDFSRPFLLREDRKIGKILSSNVVSAGDEISLRSQNFRVLKVKHGEKASSLIVETM